MGPLKLLRHLVVILLLLLSFYRKGKAKIFFLQQHFPIYIKKLEHGLNEFFLSVFSLFIEKGCNFNIKTLKPSLTKLGFFSFVFSMGTMHDMNKIMKCLKLGEYYI